MPVSAKREFDIGAILAVTWVMVAVGLTVLFAPQLGIRGLGWLAAHHLLCIVGVSHERTRYRKRQALRMASRAGAASAPSPSSALAPEAPAG